MEKEFNLSDWIDWCHEWELKDEKDVHPSHKQDVIIVPKIKEFIKRLKEGLELVEDGPSIIKKMRLNRLKDKIIDKLAGDDLI